MEGLFETFAEIGKAQSKLLSEQIEVIKVSDSKKNEWRKERKLGSSDAPTILGVNPYKTKLQLFLELTNSTEIKCKDETEAMSWGKILEPVIANEFSARTGLAISANKLDVYTHPLTPYMTATPDYFVEENGEVGILEIKNTSAYNSKTWQEGIGDYAHIQLMHQLAVCGLSFGYVAALVGGNKLVWHRVERDRKLITLIEELEGNFWEQVLSKTPPLAEAKDHELLDSLYPRAIEAKRAQLVGNIEVTLRTAEALKAEIKEKQTHLDAALVRIKEHIGDAEEMTNDNFQVTWKNQTRNSVDTTKLKKEQPEIYNQFLKESSFRVLKITNLKGE